LQRQIVDLKTYFRSESLAAKKLAQSLDISPSHLSQMASGKTPVSPARAVQIENATGGVVTRRDLYPDTWEKIWPELRDTNEQAAA
jgi:DNA-binding transcriptional regulator YdaS (Cro superfamily)